MVSFQMFRQSALYNESALTFSTVYFQKKAPIQPNKVIVLEHHIFELCFTEISNFEFNPGSRVNCKRELSKFISESAESMVQKAWET